MGFALICLTLNVVYGTNHCDEKHKMLMVAENTRNTVVNSSNNDTVRHLRYTVCMIVMQNKPLAVKKINW